jgi:hypothetical protein
MIAALLVLAAAKSFALEASALKKPCDKAGNFLIEQFDLKTLQYKGVKADDIATQAVIVAALGEHFRKYREGHGPWMSEPAKAVAQVGEQPGAARDWALFALQATQNERHKARIEALAGKGPLPSPAFSKTTELAPAAVSKEWLLETVWKARALSESKTREIDLEGGKVKWAEVLGENIVKLQQKDGSFSDDLQTNALASLVLTYCYRALKQ